MPQQMERNHGLLDLTDSFLQERYKERVLELAGKYPKDSESLYINAVDLYRFNPDLLDDFLKRPGKVKQHFRDSLADMALPVDVDLSGADIRLTDKDNFLDRVGVGELYSEHETRIVAVRGRIGQVTGSVTKITEAAYECIKCGKFNYIPQPETQLSEPVGCEHCERESPGFKLNFRQSETVDQKKLKLEQPPHEQTNGSGQELVVYNFGDLIHVGGENGLQDKAGEMVTIIGRYTPDRSDLQGKNPTPTYDNYLVAEDYIFEDGQDESIDVEKYREEVEKYAGKQDAIDIFKKSIDPGLTMTAGWNSATEMATAYLFGAPRIDPPEGDMVRGDIHMLFVSDPGMRKSVFAKRVAELSPRAELRQSTGMSSEVGLTAAAQKDDFGEGQWSLSPGALPRANGGHLILDEIDKGPSNFLDGIHDPLEGEQELKVDKAGIQATMATRVGFMALGNPKDGRFDKYSDIPEQIGLDPALMSRFDLIATMQDKPDSEEDETIASGVLDSIDESARIEYGTLEPEEAENINAEVSRDVLKAWVTIAREEIQPLLTEEAKDILREFYVETRDLNDANADQPPVTARALVAGVRIAMAFARCELSESVTQYHAERAKELSKHVIKNNFDPDTGEWDADRTNEGKNSQQKRMDRVRDVLVEADEPITVDELADKASISQSRASRDIEKLQNAGDVSEPETNKYRWIA